MGTVRGVGSDVPEDNAPAADRDAEDRPAMAARLDGAHAPISSTSSRAARGGSLPGDPDYLDGGLGRFGLGRTGRLAANATSAPAVASTNAASMAGVSFGRLASMEFWASAVAAINASMVA